MRLKGLSEVSSICTNQDSSLLGIIKEDTTIEIFDLETGTSILKQLKVIYSQHNNIFFNEENEAITYGGDHVLRVWDLEEGQRKGLLSAHTDKVMCVCKSENDALMSVSLDKTIRLWDMDTRTCVITHKMIQGHVNFIDLSSDNRLLLVCEDTRTLAIYDMATKKQVWLYEDYEEVFSAYWICVPHTILVVSSGNVRVVNIMLNCNRK